MRSRTVLALCAVLVVGGCSSPAAETPVEPPVPSSSPTTSSATTSRPAPDFAGLETEFDARLGLWAIDTGTGATVEHRADERFAFASTYKALAAAAVLGSGADLDAVVRYSESDLVTYSPVTSEHVATGLTLREVAEAAVTVSDNTAGNLLLDAVGGPAGFTQDLRELGDDVTRSDREEPDLNDWAPGELRDTSSPRAFGTSLQAYATGDVLDADDRQQFGEWLQENTTGDEQIRAGVPPGFLVGDKTGHAGVYGNQNDVAVLWPADGSAPWVLVVFSDRADPDDESDDALLARAAELVVERFS